MKTTPSDAVPNPNWFHIEYSDAAPSGLPPLIQAAHVLRYTDDTGSWVVALWDLQSPNPAISACILRVPADQVGAITRHGDMGAAAAHQLRANTERTTTSGDTGGPFEPPSVATVVATPPPSRRDKGPHTGSDPDTTGPLHQPSTKTAWSNR